MKRLLFAAIMATASVVASTPAHAQMAGALGKPLESPDLPAGTISVRVVEGGLGKPVIGTDVTLLVDGTPRVARTGTDGRALFKDVSGNQLQAKVAGEDKEVASDVFTRPAAAGVKIMLSTVPWNESAPNAGAPPMAGGKGMPNPRQMSGEPRPEQADPAGTFTVRLTYDDFSDPTPPAGIDVALVGYHANDLVDMQIEKSDAQGRAKFTGLDRTGATSYFALALLPRNDKLDRLTSTPAILDSRMGVRLILSSDKRTSTAPPVDDLTKYESQDSAPAAGKVSVALEGGVDPNGTVSLVEITTPSGAPAGAITNERRVFAKGKVQSGPPDPKDIMASAEFSPKTDLPPHTVEVKVRGGVNQTNNPLEGVSVNITPAAQFEERRGLVDAKTSADGISRVTVDPAAKGPFVATLVINGKSLTSKPFELSTHGGTLDVEAHWSSEGKPQVEFDVTPRPGQVFYAETVMHGVLFRSLPFQPVPDRGTRVTIYVVPRIVFSFSLTSRMDDKYLAVNGRFDVANNAWAPYAGGPDGMLLPLPKGFTGGLVAEKDQADVALVPGQGFRIIRPLPPGEKKFHGAFSLGIDNGTVKWHLDLPYGSGNSGMEILQPPGMQVTTPPGVRGETVTVAQGTFFVLPQISIMPRQSMVMTITGLPQPPAWKIWMPRIFGVLVILLMLGGVAIALVKNRDVSDRDARRQKLLDELVEIEANGKTSKNAKRREQIMAELESLWGDEAA